jgi:uncharacterized RDD family membrane protein YckC
MSLRHRPITFRWMTESFVKRSPSLLRRLAAMLYDTFLVLPLIMVAVALFMGLRALLGIGPDADGTVQLNAHLVQLIALLTVVAFFSWFWLKNSQTLGMQAWRIKLVQTTGGKPSAGQILLRCLGAMLSAGCLGLGYLWCLVDRNKRYWHDYISSTELVLLPKKGLTGTDPAAAQPK